MLWRNYAREVVGIEPNQDMIRLAEGKLCGKTNIRFVQSTGTVTGLPDCSTDIVTCVQSFHWLDQNGAFDEFQRILKPGGILAILDNDFPPVSFLQADRAYNLLLEAEAKMEQSYPKLKESYVKADKSKNLKSLRECGRFSYVREIVFCNMEECDAIRYIELALSQSPLQRIMNAKIEEMKPFLDVFKRDVEEAFCGGRAQIEFCYRLCLAVN
jgi:ubiquinone/menaquinone biosynthesis C-methylase UbiE